MARPWSIGALQRLTIWLVMRLGRRWFNPEAGWWALAFAIAPLYFGRAFQAEALLLLCRRGPGEPTAVGVATKGPGPSGAGFASPSFGLIKVIPLLWLGTKFC